MLSDMYHLRNAMVYVSRLRKRYIGEFHEIGDFSIETSPKEQEE